MSGLHQIDGIISNNMPPDFNKLYDRYTNLVQMALPSNLYFICWNFDLSTALYGGLPSMISIVFGSYGRSEDK